MKIPCKGCLSYPICIGQKQLSCEDLHDFFRITHRRLKVEAGEKSGESNKFTLPLEKRNEIWDELWEILYKTLPNIKGMFRNTAREQELFK